MSLSGRNRAFEGGDVPHCLGYFKSHLTVSCKWVPQESMMKDPRRARQEDIQEAKNRRSYAFGGDEVWPFFCGYGHAKVRHVPTTACYPRQIAWAARARVVDRQQGPRL